MIDHKNDSEGSYRRFVDEVRDNRIVWGLKSSEGWAITESSEFEDAKVMPFWSDKANASRSAEEEWSNYDPARISFDDFIDKWLKGMFDDGLLVGVNWDTNLVVKEVEPDELAQDLVE